jgi:replicative DNA helicase
MQIHSQTAELRALLTVTTKKIPEDQRTLWLGKLNKDLFHTPVMRKAFERISKLAKKRFKIISWKSLLEDPSLDEDIRDLLAETREKPCAKKSQMRETLETLEEFRKIRIMRDVALKIVETLEQPAVEAEALLLDITQQITRANAAKQQDAFFLHFGADSNSQEIIDAICRNETLPRIKTGYTEYDKTNGGFPDSGVVILAGTTSGGKSTIAMNICRHMYLENNMSTFRITLEMQEIQETQRLMSHMTGIPLKRFKHAKLTMEDKRKILKANEKLRAHGKKHGINYTTHSPKGGLSMAEALQLAKPFGYKVIVIDYVGLLTEEAGADQWRSLMDAARMAKNYTQETGALVILLAQLDDESEKLRYSKGMKEHADVLWQWNYSKAEQRELKVIPVVVSKDRDGELMAFELEEDFATMTARNPGEKSMDGGGGGNLEFDDETENESGPKKLKKKKTKGIGRDEIITDLKPSLKKKKKTGKTKLLRSDDGPPALS